MDLEESDCSLTKTTKDLVSVSLSVRRDSNPGTPIMKQEY